MGRFTMVGKTSSLSAFREKATSKMEYWDADPLQTLPAAAHAFTQNPGVIKTSCLAWTKRVSLATGGHLRAQTSARSCGCRVSRQWERCTEQQCGNHTLSFSLYVVKTTTLICLKSKTNDVSSTMFTSLVSDKMNLIPKPTLPHKELTLGKSPSDKTRKSWPLCGHKLQHTTFCNVCNAASVKHFIQMKKKKKLETEWV